MQLLPSGWYQFTISQARFEDIKNFKHLVLVFTVNTGEFAYRNILKRYPMNKTGLSTLEKDMASLKLLVLTEPDSDYFLKQFTEPAKHGEMLIGRIPKDNVIKNIITEFKITTKEPEKNVLIEKDEEHFYKETKGRGLPLL